MANFNIDAFYKGFAGNAPWDVPARIVRGAQVPLDATSLFKDLQTAKDYAAGGETLLSVVHDGKTLTYNPATSYPGQFIAVANASGVTGYLIGQDRNLIELGSATDAEGGVEALSTELYDFINNLSTNLSTEISAEAIARDEAVKTLSVALSTDVDSLSTRLSTEISAEAIARDEAVKALSVALSTDLSAEVIARDEAIKALSVALSTDVDSLSTRLSTEISALNSNADKAIEDLSTALSTDVDSLSTRLSAEVKDLSTALSTDIDSLSTRLSTEVKDLSTALSTDVDSLSVRLSTEISAETKAREDAIKALEDKLSSAWQFRGTVDATAAEDNVTKINEAFDKPQPGDVVIVNKKFVDEDGTESIAAIEYAFDGEHWQQLGDESSNVSKFQLKSAIEGLSAALSTDVDSLSTRLSTEISAEAIARDEAVKALSVALSTDVDSLSVRLSTEISALNANADKAVEDLSVALSTDVDSLSTRLSTDIDSLSVALSTEISAEAIARDEAVKALSVALSTDVDDLSVRLSTEISVLNANADKAVEDLSIALSTDVDSLSTRLSTEIDSLSVALSTDLSAEIEARKANDTYLSTKINYKVLAQIGDDAPIMSVDTLTMHKISAEKYAELLATPGGIVDTDLYVVSSENTDAYGRKVVNVANAEDDGDAVNYAQFKALSVALSTDVKLSVETLEQKIEEAVEGGVEALSTELLDATTGKIPLLDAKVDEISSNLSDEIEALSSALSTDIDTLSADVYKDLSVAMTTTLGATDDVLSTFTFTQNGKTIGTIDLPKDKVIDSAQVVFGTLADGTFTPEAEGSEIKSEAAKFYLEVVVANQTDKLYIPVPELADTYVGHTGTYVAVTVQSDADGARCISADIVPNSITNDKMADDSITMRNLSGEFIFDCGHAFGYNA